MRAHFLGLHIVNTRALLITLLGILVLFNCTEQQHAEHDPQHGEKQHVLRFVDVAPHSGLAAFRHVNGSEGAFWYPEQMGAGGGFIDYDNDSWEDIILVGGGRLSPSGPDGIMALRLFRNQGDGTFKEVTQSAGLADARAYGTGVAVADYDNDGDQDIFLAAFGENLLFRNDSDPANSALPTFVEMGHEAGIAGPLSWGSSALFFDANLDGFLDLYVVGYTRWSVQTDQECFRDNGNALIIAHRPPTREMPAISTSTTATGPLQSIPNQQGLTHPALEKALALAEWDFNQDGWPDVVVVNDGEPDLLFINKGDGTFTEEGLTRGIAFGEHGEARAGMGIDIGIVDSTGFPSIFVGNFSSEMISVYRQTQNGWFVDRAAVSGLGRSSLNTLAFGVLLFDAELDADLDVFVANGHVYLDPIDGSTYRQPPHLFVNEGDGTFHDRAPAVGGALEMPMVARAVAKADFDKDGDIDLLVTENNGPVHLLRNDSGRGNSIRLQLNGQTGNADALGAHLTAHLGNKTQIQRVRTGSGYLSQSEKVITFGLGAAERLDSLLIVWPGGRREALFELQAEHEYRVLEGAGVQSKTPFSVMNPPHP